MANHSPEPDNYITTKKTFEEAMNGASGSATSDAKARTKKGEAAKNGGGE